MATFFSILPFQSIFPYFYIERVPISLDGKTISMLTNDRKGIYIYIYMCVCICIYVSLKIHSAWQWLGKLLLHILHARGISGRLCVYNGVDGPLCVELWVGFGRQQTKQCFSGCDYTDTVTSEAPWWRPPIETFSTFLALCAGNSPVTGKFPAQRPVTRSFNVFFDLHHE